MKKRRRESASAPATATATAPVGVSASVTTKIQRKPAKRRWCPICRRFFRQDCRIRSSAKLPGEASKLRSRAGAKRRFGRRRRHDFAASLDVDASCGRPDKTTPPRRARDFALQTGQVGKRLTREMTRVNQEEHESGENPNRQSTGGKEKGGQKKKQRQRQNNNEGEKE